MEGPEQEAPRGGVWERHRSPFPLGSLGAPEKNSIVNFEIAYFLHFRKLKWSYLKLSAVSAYKAFDYTL